MSKGRFKLRNNDISGRRKKKSIPAMVMVIIVFWIVLSIIVNPPGEKEEADSNNNVIVDETIKEEIEIEKAAEDNYSITISEATDLQIRCKRGVEGVLKSPSTAKFPKLDNWSMSKDNDKITVQSYVDSENSFGATLRSEFQVVFTANAEDVTSFIFEGKEYIN